MKHIRELSILFQKCSKSIKIVAPARSWGSTWSAVALLASVNPIMGYFERFIVEHQLSDVFMLSPERENDYLGFDPAFLVKHLSPAILIADIPVEIDYVLCAVGPRAASRNFSRTGNDSYPVQDCPMDDE